METIHELANQEAKMQDPIPTEREWFDLFTRVAVALEASNATAWLTDGRPCDIDGLPLIKTSDL